MYRVQVLDNVKFEGTHEECKEYITSNYSPEDYDDLEHIDAIHMLSPSGRSTSYVLEWEL